MVFWGGKESTQGSLTLFLGFTPSLNLLHCLAIALTKKKSFILVPFLGGKFAGGESAWWRGNWIPLLHSNWLHLLQHLIDPSFLGKIGLQH